MTSEPVYLKPNVVLEPLVDRWYAWAHIVSPATAAMNITGRHLKIINSYMQAPQVHAAAAKNPKMLGGPFMDYNRERVEEIRELKAQTLEKRKQMIAFSDALRELNQLLKTHAQGFSLEPLYEQVPEILKGYVELVYDLHNRPDFRLFEALLYHSEFYDPSAQSIALWITNNDERPFCLSTPRLDEPDVLHLPIPFNHPVIDLLGSMKRNAKPLSDVTDMLDLSPEQMALFEQFFTPEAPRKYAEYKGDKIRMRYFGHACILIETGDVSILVDPLISYYGYPQQVEHFSDAHLPDVIDFVLITHNHQDHLLLETLLPLRHKIRNILVPRSGSGALQDPDLKLMLNAIGFNQVQVIEEMQSLRIGDCRITGIPFTGEHGDLNIYSKICHHVEVAGFSLLFVADSRIVEPKLYEHIHRQIGDVDVIFLGMECDGAPMSWLYGPLLPEELPRHKDATRRFSGCDYRLGMALVNIFNPGEVYVYAMGQEPWIEFISSIRYTETSNPIIASNKLVEECTGRGIVAERLFGEKELLYQRRTVPSEQFQ